MILGMSQSRPADKTANVQDIAENPPKDWDQVRRMEYLVWAEKVVNNCPKVNSALVDYFYESLASAREVFQVR